MTSLAITYSGLPPQRVFGSGTVLDTARFRAMLGEYYNVDPRSVHAYIVGEHGDSELPLWSLANIAGLRLQDFHAANDSTFDHAAHQQIFERTRDAAYAIIERKGATYYAIGLGLLTITEALLRNQRTVLTVSSQMSGQYGVSDICISLPTIVGSGGAEQILKLNITHEEEQAFRHSADTLKERLSQVRKG
jgi:L-lactate dehydrogenase